MPYILQMFGFYGLGTPPQMGKTYRSSEGLLLRDSLARMLEDSVHLHFEMSLFKPFQILVIGSLQLCNLFSLQEQIKAYHNPMKLALSV